MFLKNIRTLEWVPYVYTLENKHLFHINNKR